MYYAGVQERVRRVLVFVGVVWLLGGALLAVNRTLIWGTEALVQRGNAELAIPRQSAAGRERCAELARTIERSSSGSPKTYGAWRLGVAFGEAYQRGGFAQGAAELGVPSPQSPTNRGSVYRLRDFTVLIAEDPQCTAAALSARYGEREAALYQFGAVAGLVTAYRVDNPQIKPILEIELQFYAEKAGIPPELWKPLTGKTPGGLPAELSRIDEFVRGLR